MWGAAARSPIATSILGLASRGPSGSFSTRRQCEPWVSPCRSVHLGLFLIAGDQIHSDRSRRPAVCAGQAASVRRSPLERRSQMAVFATLTIDLFFAVFHAVNAG